MFVNLIALIVIIAIFMLFNIKNKYAAIISLYLTVITFLLFIGLLYLSKLHYYTFPLRIDYITCIYLGCRCPFRALPSITISGLRYL